MRDETTPMIEDEDKPKAPGLPRLLDTLSVDELDEYVSELKAEITRVEGEITRKNTATNAAEGFFKSTKEK